MGFPLEYDQGDRSPKQKLVRGYKSSLPLRKGLKLIGKDA